MLVYQTLKNTRKKKFNPNYTKRKQRRGVKGLTTLGFDNN
jgi:hypothetical protein